MRPGIKTDLQVALYSYARYLDLESARICPNDVCGIISLYLITNTKFTDAVVKYAKCSGIKLLSWDYPKGDSLQAKIERNCVYPITVLTRLSSGQKQQLLQQGIILCSDIAKRPHLLQTLGLSGIKIDALLKEINALCGSR
jgi:hypothetical protein